MREVLTTIGELVGALVVAIGLGMLAPWLGVAVGGVLVAAFSWLASHEGAPEPEPITDGF